MSTFRRRARASQTHINWTFEELGRNEGKALDVCVHFEIDPGEERTYDYPGSGPTFEITGVDVIGFDNDTDLNIKLDPSWKPTLEKLALQLCEQRKDDIIESLIEDYE